MIKTTVPIKGMHCKACEVLIGESIQSLPGIQKVKVSLKHRTAEIFSKHHPDMEKVGAAIIEAGYEIGTDDKKLWFSRNLADYKETGVALVILLAVYFILSALGVGNINLAGNSAPSSLVVVLLVGVTAGFSTCMALVGGLVLGIAARHAEKHPEATVFQKFRPHIYFNIGRIFSYFLLGGVIGAAGKIFQLTGMTLGILTVAIGLVMLFLGIKLTELSPKISAASLALPSGISKILGIRKHHEKEYSHINSLVAGGLTFFLPCGFTQAMQLYAMTTGNFWAGALIMGVFALGTAPGLIGIGGLTSVIKGAFAKKFFKFAGVVVVAFALFNISNGVNLTGWTIDLSGNNPVSQAAKTNVSLEDGVQVARMDQTAYGYSPNEFIVKKGIPVKWIINAKDLNSCSSSISMPKLNILKNLSLGENSIEFTPDETGIMKFTCSMGMYPGSFRVVEDSTIKKEDNSKGLTENNNEAKKAAIADSGNFARKDGTEIQVISTVFNSPGEDIQPNEFTVTAGKPVRFEVNVQADGQGCMSTIMIPGLADTPKLLTKGEIIKFDFTPAQKGVYEITCAMGVPRGKINVV